MIRPIGYNNSVSFGHIIEGHNNKIIYSKADNERKYGLTKSEKNIFLAGAFLGATLGIGGTYIYQDSKVKSMMLDAQEELQQGVDSLIVKDLTDDDVPEIILVGNDGCSSVYDMRSKKVFLKMGDDMIEKDN